MSNFIQWLPDNDDSTPIRPLPKTTIFISRILELLFNHSFAELNSAKIFTLEFCSFTLSRYKSFKTDTMEQIIKLGSTIVISPEMADKCTEFLDVLVQVYSELTQNTTPTNIRPSYKKKKVSPLVPTLSESLVKIFESHLKNAEYLSKIGKNITLFDECDREPLVLYLKSGVQDYYEDIMDEILKYDEMSDRGPEWPCENIDNYYRENILIRKIITSFTNYNSFVKIDLSAVNLLSHVEDEYRRYFAIKLISNIIWTSLDHFVFIETKYGIINKFAELKRSKNGIIDNESVALDLILAENFNLLEENQDGRQRRREDEIGKNKFVEFLENHRYELHDLNWLNEAKKFFDQALVTSSYFVRRVFLSDLLEQVCDCLGHRGETPISSPLKDESTDISIHQMDKLSASFLNINDATFFQLLNQYRKNKNKFDWFIAIIYKMLSHDVDKCHTFLHRFKLCNNVANLYLWPSDDDLIIFNMGHYIEMILANELPGTYRTLINHSVIPSILSASWIRQCFLNILEWKEVTIYIHLIILFGADYIIYLCVAIFYHLREDIDGIFSNYDDDSYVQKLRKIKLKNFQLGDYLSYFSTLSKKYKKPHLSQFNYSFI